MSMLIRPKIPPPAISEKFLKGNKDQDTMMFIYNSLASSGAQACNAILQTALCCTEGSLEESQRQAMEQIWRIHCSQMNRHLDATCNLVFPTLEKSGLDSFSMDEIVQAQTTLRKTMAKAELTLQELVKNNHDSTALAIDTIVEYQEALTNLLNIQNEEILISAKSSVDKKVWDKMNKDFMSQGGDMGSFIHFMGEDEFRNGWGKGQPGFLWNLVFSKNLRDFQVAFTVPMETLESAFAEKQQQTLDLSYSPSLEAPVPSSMRILAAPTFTKKEESRQSLDVETATTAAALNVATAPAEVAVVQKKRKRDMLRNLFRKLRVRDVGV